MRAQWRLRRHRQMQTWLTNWEGHMPPSARDEEHVAVLQHAVPYRGVRGLGRSFVVVRQWVQARWPINLPALPSRNLQDHDLRAVKMQIEAFLAMPSRIEINVSARMKRIPKRGH